MMLFSLAASLAAGFTYANALSHSTQNTLLAVNTTSGYVRGTISPYRSNITVYRGIPFAAPPTGQYRWTAPRSPEPWDDVFNATEFGPQCAQSYSPAGIFSSGRNTTSEDCLTLNIWTPPGTTSSQKLPVFVWIYGGRFSGGSGDVKTYDGSGLASKGVIVVTINYRLGAFGFLAHPDLSAESGHNASGNYGLLDQQFALQWVQDNIENFGGNASQVTVGGQSAGSASALDMMYSPLSKGLIHGVISESGARSPHDPLTGGLATSYRTKTDAEQEGVKFLATMNVTSIAALRNVSTAALIAEGNESDTTYDGTVYENITALTNPPLWRPVVDGYVLPYGYGEALALNAHADVPVLTGSNYDEGGSASSVEQYQAYSQMFQNFSGDFFTLYPGNSSAQVSNSSTDFWRDVGKVSTWQWAKYWIDGGAKSDVFIYLFDHPPAENRDAGSYHGAELWFTFNNIPYASYSNVTWTAADYEVERTLSDYWVNFISTGNPNGGNLTTFPPSAADVKQIMALGDDNGAEELASSEAKIDFILDWFSTLSEW